MTLDVIINLRASVCYSLSGMVREHTGEQSADPHQRILTLISEFCVCVDPLVKPIIHSKQITARVPWREQGSVHNKYACRISINPLAPSAPKCVRIAKISI